MFARKSTLGVQSRQYDRAARILLHKLRARVDSAEKNSGDACWTPFQHVLSCTSDKISCGAVAILSISTILPTVPRALAALADRLLPLEPAAVLRHREAEHEVH